MRKSDCFAFKCENNYRKRRFVAVLCLLSYKLKIAWRLHCKHWGNFVVPAGRYDLSSSSVNIVKARNSHDPVEFDFIIYSHNLFISLNVEELHFYLNKKWVFNSVFGWSCGYNVHCFILSWFGAHKFSFSELYIPLQLSACIFPILPLFAGTSDGNFWMELLEFWRKDL